MPCRMISMLIRLLSQKRKLQLKDHTYFNTVPTRVFNAYTRVILL
jgi:hypothetical protein